MCKNQNQKEKETERRAAPGGARRVLSVCVVRDVMLCVCVRVL